MAAALASLTSLGIPKQRAAFALKEYHGDVESAAEWCFDEGANWTPADLLGSGPPPRIQAPPETFAFTNSRSSSTTAGDALPGPIPPHSALIPGTKVLLVKKEDQATGRLTEGVVRERLTKGDHPRGVKVRTEDGTVGRVQKVIKS